MAQNDGTGDHANLADRGGYPAGVDDGTLRVSLSVNLSIFAALTWMRLAEGALLAW